MKKIISFVFILILKHGLYGQGVSISLSNHNLDIQIGSEDSCIVNVAPFGGFNQQIIFQSVCLSGACTGISINFFPSAINYPYTNGAELTVNVGPNAIPGQFIFLITGSNGPVSAQDTLFVTILSSTCILQGGSYSPSPGFSRTMAIDQNGIKWLAGQSNLYKYNSATWIEYNTTNSQLPAYTSDVAVAKDSTVWISTFNGLCNFDGTFWTIYNISNSGLMSNVIGSIAIDSMNNVWITATNDYNIPNNTGGGLYKFDGQTWTKFDSLNSPLPNNRVGSVSIDNNGVIWLTCSDYDYNVADTKIIKYDGTNWTIYNSTNSCLPATKRISRIRFDSDNNAWFAIGYNGSSTPLFGHGLMKTNGSTWEIWHDSLLAPYNHTVFDSLCNIVSQDNESKLPSPDVWDVFIDSRNRFWIATYWGTGGKGLIKVENGSWELFNATNSQLSYNALGAMGEFQDTIWMSSTTSYSSTSGNNLSFYTCDEMTTGKNEITSNPFTIYPNPTSGVLNLDVINGFNNSYLLKLYDFFGIKKDQFQIQNGKNVVNLKNYKKGIYFYSFQTPNKSYSGKIIVF